MVCDFEDKMSRFLTELERAGLCNTRKPVGSTEQEVQALEQRVGVRLPAAYKAYLRKMGHGAGDFFAGTEIFLPQVPGLTDYARDVLNELDGTLQLPPDVLVFGCHQGYVFYYFRTEPPSDDPPVYRFTDEDAPNQISDSFTGFLDAKVASQVTSNEIADLKSLYWRYRHSDETQAYSVAKRYLDRCRESDREPSEDVLQWLEAFERGRNSAPS